MTVFDRFNSGQGLGPVTALLEARVGTCYHVAVALSSIGGDLMTCVPKLPALLMSLLVLCAVTPSVRADLHLVALDGSDKTVKPEEYGYKVDMYRSGKGNKCLTIRLVLTEEAARSFRFGRLTLTKGEQTIVET